MAQAISASNRWHALVVFSILLLEVVLFQVAADAYSSGYGGHPDEAAHFVSSLLVHDFLGRLPVIESMAFANDFYMHYPKVAIGNWPPLLYVLLAVWMLVFGTTRAAALMFIAVTAASTGTLIYLAGRRLLSAQAGLFAAALYLAIPLVQESSGKVMTEHLVTLLILASTLLFARFFHARTISNALLFGFAAAAAILTRGSAWSLLFVPPIVILMTREWRFLLDWKLWMSATPVAVFCIPWYFMTRGMSKGAMVGTDPNAPAAFFLEAGTRFPIAIYQSLGVVLAFLAVLGLWASVRNPPTRQHACWAALAAMVSGILLIHCIVPAALEARYMMQLLPAVLLFAGAGTTFLIRKLPPHLQARRFPMSAAWTIVAGAAVWPIFAIPTQIRNHGYEQAASRAVEELKTQSGSTVLLASDSIGEGSLIAEIAAQEKRPSTMVLRGSKILASEDWLGRDSRERFPTDESMTRVLNAVPVTAVVIDRAMDKHWERAYHKRLEALLVSNPQKWRLDQSFSVMRNGNVRPGTVSIFVRKPSPDQQIANEANKPYVAKLMQRD